MTAAALLLSVITLDLETLTVARKHWDDHAVPIGSLAKPFIAYAYARKHPYPKLRCDRCWKPDGHGELGIRRAIAESCNTYFDTLRAALTRDELLAAANRFGLDQMESASPESIVRAYAELWKRRDEPGVEEILAGMRESAKRGTSRAVGVDSLAKTGTAACTHRPKAPGDGFAVVLYPAVNPRSVTLVRVHGKPGAAAAKAARGYLISDAQPLKPYAE